MTRVPWGALPIAAGTLLAVSPVRRPRALGTVSWMGAMAVNELPVQFAAIALVSTAPSLLADDTNGQDPFSLVLTALTLVGLLLLLGRSLRAGGAIERASADALGPGWRLAIDPGQAGRPRPHLPGLRILAMPWPIRPGSVERTADVRYGSGACNVLDVYRHRSRPQQAPTLVYLHGGRFTRGRKSFESRPLLHHLASHGWTCLSANHHLAATPATRST